MSESPTPLVSESQPNDGKMTRRTFAKKGAITTAQASGLVASAGAIGLAGQFVVGHELSNRLEDKQQDIDQLDLQLKEEVLYPEMDQRLQDIGLFGELPIEDIAINQHSVRVVFQTNLNHVLELELPVEQVQLVSQSDIQSTFLRFNYDRLISDQDGKLAIPQSTAAEDYLAGVEELRLTLNQHNHELLMSAQDNQD